MSEYRNWVGDDMATGRVARLLLILWRPILNIIKKSHLLTRVSVFLCRNLFVRYFYYYKIFTYVNQVHDTKIKVLANLKQGTNEESAKWKKLSTTLKVYSFANGISTLGCCPSEEDKFKPL